MPLCQAADDEADSHLDHDDKEMCEYEWYCEHSGKEAEAIEKADCGVAGGLSRGSSFVEHVLFS